MAAKFGALFLKVNDSAVFYENSTGKIVVR